MITDKQKEILQHTLGADSRYKKSQWGFRNHYQASKNHVNRKEVERMVKEGLMEYYFVHGMGDVYSATEKGMGAIGFTKKQILKIPICL